MDAYRTSARKKVYVRKPYLQTYQALLLVLSLLSLAPFFSLRLFPSYLPHEFRDEHVKARTRISEEQVYSRMLGNTADSGENFAFISEPTRHIRRGIWKHKSRASARKSSDMISLWDLRARNSIFLSKSRARAARVLPRAALPGVEGL